MRHLTVFATAVAFGLGVGFLVRGIRGARVGTQTLMASSSSVSQAAHPNSSKRHPPQPQNDSPLAAQLEHDLSMSAGVTRWLYWLQALEKASPADFPRLAILAATNPAALRFVGARWIEVAPRHLFDTLVAASRSSNRSFPWPELARALFAEWPKRDPDAAISALNETANLGPMESWRTTVAEAVVSVDVERGLRLMADWHIENYGPRMDAIAKWAAADPGHAAEFTADNAIGYAAQLTMETIGKTWAKTDPAGALAFALSKPAAVGSSLAAAALKQWSAQNFDAAADWLAAADPAARNRLSPAFVETWASQDAPAALDWCQQNLTGSSRSDSIAAVIKAAAEKDVGAAAALVAQMDPSSARAEAAAAVAQKFFPDPNFTPNQTLKPETLSWLSSLDPASLRRALDAAVWNWASFDSKSMAAFVAKAASEAVSADTDAVLARRFIHQNPLEAMTWASSLPDGRAIEAGRWAYGEWRMYQPEAAAKWFNDLPADDPRRAPFFDQAVQNIAYSSQAAEQLTAMTPSDQSAARSVIENMSSLPADRRAALLNALARK